MNLLWFLLSLVFSGLGGFWFGMSSRYFREAARLRRETARILEESRIARDSGEHFRAEAQALFSRAADLRREVLARLGLAAAHLDRATTLEQIMSEADLVDVVAISQAAAARILLAPLAVKPPEPPEAA